MILNGPVGIALNSFPLSFKDYRFAFDKYHKVRINSRNVTYDFKSIMHYGNYAFSSNKKETIVARNRNIKEFGNIHLSPLDIKQANLVYNCPGELKTEKHFASGSTPCLA